MIADSAKFQSDGFLVFERLADYATIAQIGALYDQMLSGEIDCSATDRKLGRITRQIMHPSLYHPGFRDNGALRAGRQIAKELSESPSRNSSSIC